jgi:hypothetical protein
MINLITDEQFSAAAIGVQFDEFTIQEFLSNESYNDALKKFILLDNFPERFGANNDINIFYNKYYWYLKFYQEYQNTHGSNMSMEQQAFKITEEGERYDDIDWEIVESIAREFGQA